ncbi:MAG: SpoIIE family protein phosphatase [Gammaproteobacteria bacterium]|jgi:phosphoserine phosphatase RsbU/P|nr:SpoIIE family protein phosphatase [Gammaproteobacteria bacterium]
MHLSIRWKLILSIVFPLIVISVVVVWFTLDVIYETAKNRLHRQATDIARVQAAQLDGKFLAVAQVAKSTAAYLEISPDLSEEQLYDLLRANLQQNPLAYGSAIAFEPYQYSPDRALYSPYVYRDGDTTRSINVATESYDYSNGGWEWYSRPRLFGHPIWTEPFYDEGAGNILMVTYSVPFYVDSKFRGVVTIDVELEALQRQIDLENIKGLPYVIVSTAGSFISHPNPDFIMTESIQSRAEKINSPEYLNFIERILHKEIGVQELHGVTLGGMQTDSTTWIFYAPIISTGWAFSTSVSESEMTSDIRSQLAKGVLGIVILLGLVIVCVLLVSTSLTRPISKLANAVARLGAGQLDSKVSGITSKDEIGQLATGFNSMLDQLNKNIKSLGREMAARELVENELTVGRDIQSSLLPSIFPPFPERKEFELHAVNQAARHVAGDFFDFFFVNQEKLVMVMADVSGKGVPAAMVMAVARTIIRNLANAGASPAEILLETNRLLLENNSPSIFITMVIACYEPTTGRLVYSNAGHHPPYRITKQGEVQKFEDASGTIVGMLDDLSFEDSETIVEAGEYIIMYTDGISEARSPDGGFYGEEYFEALLAANAGSSACEICDLTINELNGFQAGKLSDDITLLVFRRCH